MLTLSPTLPQFLRCMEGLPISRSIMAFPLIKASGPDGSEGSRPTNVNPNMCPLKITR